MKRIFLLLMMLLGALGSFPGAAAEIEIHKQQGLRYVTGGGTPDTDKQMKGLASRFPIHLFFAAKGLEGRIEGVDVTVRDVSGTVILEAKSEGPVFFIDVGSGRYTIDAEYAGERQSQTKDLTGRRYLQMRYIFNE
ncbi:MAG TPA: hypothetical protein VMW70_09005 [Burkholderiales bacterium]|nr:hypothetical protein [Burkholderiales bacterium]